MNNYQALLDSPNALVRQKGLLTFLWKSIPGVDAFFTAPTQQELVTIYNQVYRDLLRLPQLGPEIQGLFTGVQNSKGYPWTANMANGDTKSWVVLFTQVSLILNLGVDKIDGTSDADRQDELKGYIENSIFSMWVDQEWGWCVEKAVKQNMALKKEQEVTQKDEPKRLAGTASRQGGNAF